MFLSALFSRLELRMGSQLLAKNHLPTAMLVPGFQKGQRQTEVTHEAGYNRERPKETLVILPH